MNTFETASTSMPTGRRVTLTVEVSVIAFMLVGAMSCSSTRTTTTPEPHAASATLTVAAQQAMTPQEALTILKAGNERFARGQSSLRDHLAQAKATSVGQYPMAVVLSCLDSRVPVELVFDRGLGDLFVARVAGNFENTDILGSMEFATKVAGAKLIVVLGHTNCGAIKGACDGVQMGHLTSTLANITPAVETSKGIGGEHSSRNAAFVAAVTHANVRQTMADVVARSPVLKELVDAGKVAVVGGIYDLETGVVDWREN